MGIDQYILEYWREKAQNRFVERYISTLYQLGDGREWFGDEEAFVLTCDEGTEFAQKINLGASYRRYYSVPSKDADACLRQEAAKAIRQNPKTFEVVRSNLFLTIRDVADRKEREIQSKHALAFGPLYGNLCDALEIATVHRTAAGTTRVTKHDLDRWGKTEHEVVSIATANLRKHSSEPMLTLRPGCYLSDWGDDLSAARMLLSEVIDRYPVDGLPVVMVPSPRHLLLTGGNDIEGQAMMILLAAQITHSPQALSVQAMCLADEGVKSVLLHDKDTHLDMYAIEAKRRYARQKPLLEAYFSRDGLTIADYEIQEDPQTGALMGFCTWQEGVSALLPATDWISLERDNHKGRIVVQTKDVFDLCGDLLRTTAHRPVRQEVKAFPSPAQYQALSEIALFKYETPGLPKENRRMPGSLV